MISDIEQTAIHYIEVAHQSIEDCLNRFSEVAYFHQLPSVIYKPKLSLDGNQWCALYGVNLQEGVAGFGDSPALAMSDFNKNWSAPLAPAPEPKP